LLRLDTRQHLPINVQGEYQTRTAQRLMRDENFELVR
jgi:hypothetical protein